MLNDLLNDGLGFFQSWCEVIERVYLTFDDPSISIFGYTLFELLLGGFFLIAIISLIIGAVVE